MPDPSAVSWVRGGEGFIGWGELARIELRPGPDAFGRAKAVLGDLFASGEVRDLVNLPGSGPLAFCSFAFDPDSGSSVIVVPATILAVRKGVAWLTSARTAGEPAVPAAGSFPPIAPIRWSATGAAQTTWGRKVEAGLAEIRAGRLAKVVLSRHQLGLSATPIDPRRLLQVLSRRFPECYTFSCGGLVGATPELLVRLVEDRVESLVLAGSVARGGDDADDLELRAALQSSPKLLEEHRHAVDSVVAKLAPECAQISVPHEPSPLVLANIQHLSTAISGVLKGRPSVLDLVALLHPTAAVCGTPTQAAKQAIREIEGLRRARYAGPVGWIDARGHGELGLALRCASIEGSRIRMWAGAGIVAGSDPRSEWRETEVKFRAILDALADAGDSANPTPVVLPADRG